MIASEERIPFEEFYTISQPLSSDIILNIDEDGTGFSLCSYNDGTSIEAGFENFDDFSVSNLNAPKSLDKNSPNRLFQFELIEDKLYLTKGIFFGEQLIPVSNKKIEVGIGSGNKELVDLISYVYILKSKVEKSVLIGIVYCKNKIVIGNLKNRCRLLEWSEFQPIRIDSLSAFELLYQEFEVVHRWGQKPMSNSEKGKKSQLMKRQNQSISMTKDIQNIIISPLSEKSRVNHSTINKTSIPIFSDCNFNDDSVDNLFLSSNVTTTSDITNATSLDFSSRRFSEAPQLRFSSNICAICEKYIGIQNGECKPHYFDKKGNINFAPNDICGYPDQLNLACIDNICFIVMITLYFLNTEGSELFEKVNGSLYCNLTNLLYRYDHSIVLKSQLIKLLGYNIKLNVPALAYFDSLKNHKSVSFIIGIDAIFTHSLNQKNIFDIVIEGNYSCNICGTIIFSETLEFRTLKCDSKNKRNFRFNDLFKDSSTNGSHKYCNLCNQDNQISIHNSKIINRPAFIFIIYTDMNSYEDGKSLYSIEDSILSETICNADLMKFSLIGYSYEEGSEFYSNSYNPFGDSIIQFDGKKNGGVVAYLRKKSFITSEAGLGIYINENYFDRNKLVTTNYSETEEIKELTVTKKKRSDIVLSESDLYFKESNYITQRLRSVGNGLFCIKDIAVGTRFPSFKGIIISLKDYCNKATNEKGYGIQIVKNESICDCYPNRTTCLASYANDSRKLMHNVSKAVPDANTKCVRCNRKNSTINVEFILEAIKEIKANEEILWNYDEIIDEYL